MRLVLGACVLAAVIAGPACAAAPGGHGTAPPLLTEDQALVRAVDFLRGTDYGDSFPGIIGRIRDRQLMTTGSNDCGPIRTPVWAFHIQSPHDGWLYIDATTGAKSCSSLPFAR